MESDNLLIKRQWFIQKREGRIEDVYQFDQKHPMGKGQFGSVVKATLKGSTTVRAIKIIRKKKVKDPIRLVNEVSILKNVDHPNVVRLFEIFETPQKLYLVMEYCSGKEVFERCLKEGQGVDQERAKRIFRDVVEAIAYCHNQKICHRDLKPENLLFANKEEDSPVKVIDFGLSARFDHNQRMKTFAGTCYFMSPEVINGVYDESCDVWSLGVILYFLLSGVPPFYGETEYEILQMVKSKEYSLKIPEFDKVSEQAKDLIDKCFQPSNQRIHAAEMLEHPWLKFTETSPTNVRSSTFHRFGNASSFKRLVLSFMATRISDVHNLSKLFKEHDRNHDGSLQYEQVGVILRKVGMSDQKEIQRLIILIDTDKNGKIDFNEFLAASIHSSVYNTTQRIEAAFNLFDVERRGRISLADVQKAIKDLIMTPAEWNNLLGQLDPMANGEMTLEAFSRMMSII